jgi:hypothetical protein
MRMAVGVRFPAVLLALLLLPAASPAAGPATRTFADQYGRTVVGEIVEAGEKQVKIRRDDGQVFTLDIARLSDPDAAYVAQWRHDHVRIKLRLEMSSFRNTVGSTPIRRTSDVVSTDLILQLSAGYEIRLTNDSPDTADSLRVEYNVFQLNSDATYTRTTGTANPTPLPFKKTWVVRTAPLHFSQLRAADGAVAPQSFAGELAGLWVRVLRDGKVVAELVSNERVRALGWQEPQAPAGSPVSLPRQR